MAKSSLFFSRLKGYHLTGIIPSQPCLFVFGPKASAMEIQIVCELLSRIERSTQTLLPHAEYDMPIRWLLSRFSIHYLKTTKPDILTKELASFLSKHVNENVAIPLELMQKCEPEVFKNLGMKPVVPLGIDRKKRRLKSHTAFVLSNSSARDLRFVRDTLSVYSLQSK